MGTLLAFKYLNINGGKEYNMGAIQWILKKVTKVFSRTTNALFYNLLYREIIKEINNITKNEEQTLNILKEVGRKAALESCERHSNIFKFMPGTPGKVVEYFEILWSIVFGVELGEFSYETLREANSKYDNYLITIKKCPICAGYGTDDEDTFNFSKLKEKNCEGMACGLCGMLEGVANYILKLKRNDYRIGISEIKCIAREEEALQLDCKVYDYQEWKEMTNSTEGLEEDHVQETKMDLIDSLQNFLSFDNLEKYFDEPLENIKDRVATLIREKMNLEPENFFEYFQNYEDDMIRILGFLFIHLLNEYGGVIEKSLQNQILAKIFGYIFQQLRQMILLFIPLDVINDYHELLISFLDGLAPSEMVENLRIFSGKDDIYFFFEGAQIALENLGIDFSELKENIWEELKKESETGLIDSEATMIDKSRETFPKIIKIIQEILMLISEILTLPVRMLISESHHGIKSAINSVFSEEEGLYGSFKERLDSIFDTIQEIRT
ncbi:MAG: hypothetical protein ACTSXH_05270 [Promethearchaeota archaeon]